MDGSLAGRSGVNDPDDGLYVIYLYARYLCLRSALRLDDRVSCIQP